MIDTLSKLAETLKSNCDAALNEYYNLKINDPVMTELRNCIAKVSAKAFALVDLRKAAMDAYNAKLHFLEQKTDELKFNLDRKIITPELFKIGTEEVEKLKTKYQQDLDSF